MELLGIAGIGTAGWAGYHLADRAEVASTFAPGTAVIDTDVTTPDTAIVLLEPSVPINDWLVNPGETVADHNPTYSGTDSVVIVAFEHMLSRKWPAWQTVKASQLFEEVAARSIKFYAFPSTRLAPV